MTGRRNSPLSHVLVGLQLVSIFLCCYPQSLKSSGSAWWLILFFAGATLGVIVLCYNRPGNFNVYPEIRNNARLITRGPYRYIRHPMYTALIISMIGIAGFNGHWINFAGLVALIAVLYVKARREERLLTDEFSMYREYARSSWRFLPGIY